MSPFSGFVLKTQANMDPNHRDRTLSPFVRHLPSGHEDASFKTGGHKVADAVTFMGGDRGKTEQPAGDFWFA
ncbi:MAG: hypothetical protein CM15mP120_27890 [Pseudomonadota bacterium]|nr:MAG: hypothetical protein CM15mP120_27890 [Pseudomonadota bacterium]